MTRLWQRCVERLSRWLIARYLPRPPDFIVGGADNPYLQRWWLIPRNPVFNIYLHRFLRSDDPRALHDHPWFSASLIVAGLYVEQTIRAGGVEVRQLHERGAIRLRSPWQAHRLEIPPGRVCWTLFITGPRLREWGFHCPKGWRHFQQFIRADDPGAIGRGCE